MRLYEIGTQLEILESEFFDRQGEPDEDFYARVQDALGAEADKLENIANWILDLRARVNMYRKEISRLSILRTRHEKLCKKLERLITEHLTRRGLEKFRAGHRGLRFRVCPPRVIEVGDWDPNMWERLDTEPRLDRLKVLRNFRLTGEIPEGLDIVQSRKLVIE